MSLPRVRAQNNNFLNLFSRFEAYLAENFRGESTSQRLDKALTHSRFRRRLEELNLTADDLHNLRQLRNILAHNPTYLAVSAEALMDLNKLILAFCDKALDLATPRAKIYAASLQTRVWDIVQAMDRFDFSYVPIIEGKKFLGLFSKHILLKLVAAEKLNRTVKIEEIEDFIQLDDAEHGFVFLAASAPAEQAYHLFARYIDQGKHLGVIFLTRKGEVSGDILGLITAWDLYKRHS